MFLVRVGRGQAMLICIDQEVAPDVLKRNLDELYVRADYRSVTIAIIDADAPAAVAQVVSLINDDFCTIAVRDRDHGTGRTCIVTAAGPRSPFKIGDTFEPSPAGPSRKKKASPVQLVPANS